MKNLSKEKKQHLLLVVIGTVGAMAAIWFGLISMQQKRLTKSSSERDATEIKLQNMKDTLARTGSIHEELQTETQQLKAAESQMASGDVYEWVISTVRNFKANYPVDIPQFSTIEISETTLLPGFPYKQAKLTVAGTAYYHDLGTFIADFENQFPYIRVQNLALEPGPSLKGPAGEKLAFRMDVITLVKPEA